MSTLNGKSVASTYDQVVKRQDSYSATGNQIEIMDDSGVIKTTPLYLDSVNSRVGIGTDSPDALLHISGAEDTPLRVESTDAFSGISLSDNSTTSHGNIIAGQADSLRFRTLNTNRMIIDSAGDVTVSTGNLVIGTSGKGIDFSATSDAGGMTSELLDDYEEGTWTPTLTPSTSGTLTLDASWDTFGYTKIGNVVHVFGQIRMTSISSPVGVFVQISTPFTNGNYTDGAGIAGLQINHAVGSSTTTVETGSISESNNYINIVKDASTWGATDRVTISCSFRI